jgi:cell division protein ZapE
MPNLWTLYQEELAAKSLQLDEQQAQAVKVLDQLVSALKPKKEKFGIFRRAKPPKGLYLYGPVGRGKTMLMDLLLRQLRKYDIAVERWHFHSFMLEIHDNLRDQAAHAKTLDNRIEKLAQSWSKRVRVLCFDEFHVTDVADAMIMMPLFTALFKQGVVIVTTGNWEPDALYSGGLQRQRFLPFIDTLKQNMQIVSVAGQTDYRSLQRDRKNNWLYPLNNDTAEEFDILFRDAVGYDSIETHEIHVGNKDEGRSWTIPSASKSVAQLDMALFLSQPVGAADFIALAARYPLLFLNNLECFTGDTNNRAKRLMVMIDVLYDKGTKLVVRSDAPPEGLYPPNGALAFEFSRTVSRFKQMTLSVQS